jgi:hypothetical protein
VTRRGITPGTVFQAWVAGLLAGLGAILFGVSALLLKTGAVGWDASLFRILNDVPAAAVLVGWSRVYLGVHYPLDILAGAGIGMAVGGMIVLGLGRLLRRAGRATNGHNATGPASEADPGEPLRAGLPRTVTGGRGSTWYRHGVRRREVELDPSGGDTLPLAGQLFRQPWTQ